jgi:peptidoglycan/xylan/chitin deacetylase (PgdA/CDA1 family)
MRRNFSLYFFGFFALVACGSATPLAVDLTPYRVASSRTCNAKLPLDRGDFGGRVALTFDDGPHAEHTPAVLATLRAHRAPATFFVLGTRSEAMPELVREIAADPLFLLANHSFTHADMRRFGARRAVEESRRAGVVLRALSPATTSYFRFPYGRATCDGIEAVERTGLAVVGWNVDSFDWCFAAGRGRCDMEQDEEMIDALRGDFVEYMVTALRRENGGIVVLHDIHAHTAEVLPRLLERLESEGYSFVRLDDAAVFPALSARVSHVRSAIAP